MGTASMSDASIYRLLFESTSEALLLLRDGRIVDGNASAAALLQQSRDGLLGRSVSALSGTPQAADQLEQALADAAMGITRALSWRGRRQDGRSIGLAVVLQPLEGRAPYVRMSLVEPVATGQLIGGAREAEPERRTPIVGATSDRSMDLIRRVADAVQASRDLDVVVDRVLATLTGFCEAEAAAFYAINTPMRRMERVAVFGQRVVPDDVPASLPLPDHLLGPDPSRLPTRLVLSGQEVGESASPRPAILEKAPHSMALPLFHQDEVVGLVLLSFTQAPAMSAPDQALLQALGKVIGLALATTHYVLRLEGEIAERRQATGELAVRIRYESGLATAIQALWTDQPNALSQALKMLRRSTLVDRVYLCENVERDGRLCLQPVAEACVPEAASLLDDPSWQGRCYDDGLARWRTTLEAGGWITGLTRELPAEEQAVLAAHSVASLLILPLNIAGRWAGLLGFDMVRAETVWTDDDIRMLQTAATMIGTFFERQETQRRLARSEERFRRLAEASPDTIMILDLDTFRPLYVNRSDFLGYARVEITSDAFMRNTHPDDLQELLAHWRRVVQGDAEPFEYRVRNAAGQWEWLQNREVVMAWDATGRPTQVLVTVTVITDRKRLEAEIQESLQHRSRQVELATRVAQDIAAAAELGDLYRRVVSRVQQAFGYYYTQLFYYDPSRNHLSLVVGSGEVGARLVAKGHSLALGRGLAGTAAAQRRSILCPDVMLDSNWLPNALLPETRGELAVPILFGDRLLGVLDVQSDAVDRLSAEDQLMLEGLCGQIAIAIESKRLAEDLEQQVAELRRLQQLLTSEGWQAYRAGHGQQHVGYYFDPARKRIAGLDDGSAATIEAVGDGQASPSSLAITVRGQTIGHLGIADQAERPLSPEDEDLLGAISVQVAEALEYARLLQQTKKRAIELETVAQVSTAAATILEPDELLAAVVSSTRASFGLASVHVYLVEPETETLALAAGGDRENGQGQIAMTDEQSMVARVARSGAGETVNIGVPGEVSGAQIAVPMIAGNAVLGVMVMCADSAGFFSEGDMRTHAALASQVAVALQNARRYEEQLRTAEKLREVERLKSQFLANMSHELRTPLNSIIGFSDVLLEELDGPLTERMTEDVQMIRQSGQHLRELIGDILDMSKIEAGMMTLRPETVNAVEIVDEVMASQAQLASHRGVSLSREVQDPFIELEADPMRLRQIMLNLVTNAIKFTDEGGITVSVEAAEDRVTFSVRDTGIGMLPEHIPMIFEEFRQIDDAPTRRAGGTGLGMPISKHLVELHGGEIGVQSDLGQGSTFWFSLPRRQGAADDGDVADRSS